MDGRTGRLLYLLFVVVVASAADWRSLRVCECAQERDGGNSQEREEANSVQAASLDTRLHTQKHLASC